MRKNWCLTCWSHSFYYILSASWPNQQNGMCAQQILRSIWASAQSDQSVFAVHMRKAEVAIIRAHSEPYDETGQADLSLRWAQRSFCWFCHEATHFTSSHLRQQYWFLLQATPAYLNTITYVEVIFFSQPLFSLFLCISTPSMLKTVNMKQWVSRGDFFMP